MIGRRAAVHFKNLSKLIRGRVLLKIYDLVIYEREAIAFHGLTHRLMDAVLNHLTGVCDPDEGAVEVFGLNNRQLDEKNWFEYIEEVGVYHAAWPFDEAVSVGENLAMIYRKTDEPVDESQLSASVLHLANMVQLSITDMSRLMSDASSVVRMKVQFGRAIGYSPKMVVLCEPTENMTTPTKHQFVELLRRARRKMKFTLVLFSSDIWLLEQLADRVVFLNPTEGVFVENQLRGWYHRLLPFLKPAPDRVLQLSMEALQHGRVIRETELRLARQP